MNKSDAKPIGAKPYLACGASQDTTVKKSRKQKGISTKHMVFSLTFTVLLAALAFAQQGQPPPSSSPPPTFPEGRTAPRQQLPPDTEAPAPTSQEVERQITRGLSSEPTLSDTNLKTLVDETSVVLTGSVATEQQHQLAIFIAQSYAGQRKIGDKIKIRDKRLLGNPVRMLLATSPGS